MFLQRAFESIETYDYQKSCDNFNVIKYMNEN